MCRFIETIRVEYGLLQNIQGHQRRFERTRKAFFDSRAAPDLGAWIAPRLPPDAASVPLLKCRVVYDRQILSVEFQPYRIRPVRALRLVYADDIRYDFKYEDRQALAALRPPDLPEDADILIVKNGFVTDASYANVVFSADGLHWVTPEHCLLEGVRRRALLDEGRISTQTIRPADLGRFRYAKLINAMMEWEESPLIKTTL